MKSHLAAYKVQRTIELEISWKNISQGIFIITKSDRFVLEKKMGSAGSVALVMPSGPSNGYASLPR